MWFTRETLNASLRACRRTSRSTSSAVTTSSNTSTTRKPCSVSCSRFAAPGGVLHISIPNARHLSLILDLVVRGTFGYQPVGHRDATHLRWFTREDIVRLVEDGGWTVTEVTTHAFRPGRALITKLSRGYAREFFAVQWYVRCQA